MVLTGLDILQEGQFDLLKGKRTGLLSNPASVSKDLIHVSELFFGSPNVNLAALFTPQHGLHGHTQANMIEWEGFPRHTKYNCPVFSLYGANRKPKPELLSLIDVLVIDLQDIGARYYTYIWTMALCLEAIGQTDKEIIILDRPNPINGIDIEGPILDMSERSFVGLYPLPPRHGLTIGEIAEYLNTEYKLGANLTIIEMKNWQRQMYFEDTKLPWVMPSPNMPTVDTALVYPGQCLFEGTNLSEARGTTRPFELWGAPFIDVSTFAKSLGHLPGTVFRPVYFQPEFDKWKGQGCQGFQIHVTDRQIFQAFRTTIEILVEALKYDEFELLPPPYEYEYQKKPLQILLGSKIIFDSLISGATYPELEELWKTDLDLWKQKRKTYLKY